MSRFDPTVILTRKDGTPIPRPEPLAPDATTEQRLRWLRATHAYNDLVASVANAAFDTSLRKALK